MELDHSLESNYFVFKSGFKKKDPDNRNEHMLYNFI